jgi:hypothetical protein
LSKTFLIRRNIQRDITINVTEWTPYKTRPAAKPRLRWMDQVEEDLRRMKIIGWRVKVEDRQECSKIVEQTKTHLGLESQ